MITKDIFEDDSSLLCHLHRRRYDTRRHIVVVCSADQLNKRNKKGKLTLNTIIAVLTKVFGSGVVANDAITALDAAYNRSVSADRTLIIHSPRHEKNDNPSARSVRLIGLKESFVPTSGLSIFAGIVGDSSIQTASNSCSLLDDANFTLDTDGTRGDDDCYYVASVLRKPAASAPSKKNAVAADHRLNYFDFFMVVTESNLSIVSDIVCKLVRKNNENIKDIDFNVHIYTKHMSYAKEMETCNIFLYRFPGNIKLINLC